MTKISIIVPVYNEAKTILELLRLVASQRPDGFEFETIVIDDGSTDGSGKLLRENPDLYSRLIALPVNGGKGAAVKAGLVDATGDYVLFQDADLEYDPNDYGKLLEPIRRFGADIVMGSRLVASPITRVSYFWHRVGNRLISLVFNLINNTTFTDIYSCYLVYRRKLVDPNDIHTRGWEQHAEILSHAVRASQSMYEVPINYFGRTYGEGKKIRAYHTAAIIWTIVRTRLVSKKSPALSD